MSPSSNGREFCRLVAQVLLAALFLETSGVREVTALANEQKLVATARLQRITGDLTLEPAPTLGDRALAAVASTATQVWNDASGVGAQAAVQIAEVATAAADEVEKAPQEVRDWLERLTDKSRSKSDPDEGAIRPVPTVPQRTAPPMPSGLRAPPPSAAFGPAGAVAAGSPPALVDLSQVPLVVGANLISLPNDPPDTDPATVLAPIAGDFTVVYAYDNCDAVDPWKIYDPADLPASDLTAIDHTLGLWIDVSAATTLPSDGVQPSATQIQLCTGWNLIGYPLGQERPVPAALASIEGKYVRVFGFDVTDAADGWEVYDVAAPDWANDLQMMQPGRGYWVLATEDVLLDYENQGAPPSVEIVSPAPREEIASIVDVVGTVQSNLLDEWTLAYRESGTTVVDATWVEFATGDTPVTAQVLGEFDPTLLLNGMYDIRLQATDFQGQIVETIVPVAVDGQRKVGAFTLSFSDLQVALSGLDIEVIRTYDSRDKKKRDFGVGWTLDIKQGSYENNIVPGDGWEIVNSAPPVPFPCVGGVETKSHLTTIRLSDQEVYRFRLEVFNTGPQLGGCFGQARFAFVDGPVPDATLTILGNTDVFWGSGTDFLFDPILTDIYNPTDVRLRTRDGREFDFVLGQGVSKARDTNGNELTITPTSIAHSSGVSIAMIRDAEDRITEITDPMGSSMSYEYDGAGDLVAFTDRAANRTTMTYDANHGLLDIFDALGNRGIRNEYDADGRLVSTTDANGSTIRLSRDLDGRRELITNRLGATRVLEYDERGNISREIDELGNEVVRSFDGDDNLLTHTDSLGRTTSYSYTVDDNLESITDPLGNVASFTYDSAGRVVTQSDPDSGTTTNVYDAAGSLTEVTDALGNTTTFTYDVAGNVLTETDSLGNLTTFSYDARGNLLLEVDALANATSYTYDANGNLLTRSRTRTLGSGSSEVVTTTFVYDELGRLRSTTAADGASTSVSYDLLGRIATRTDPLGRVISSSYDGGGRLLTTTFPDGTNESFTYDPEGRIQTQSDRAGRVTAFTYDAVGRPLSTTFPDGSSTSTSYDEAGQIVTVTDTRGNSSTFEYDDNSRVDKLVDALGNTTTLLYDGFGNQTSMTDARGNTTGFAYDDLGQLTITTFADGSTATLGYDTLGQRTSQVDQAGRTTQFGYDALGRLTSVTDAAGQVTSYTYDEIGNRLTHTDAKGNTTTFAYDAVGRQISRTLPDGSTETNAYNIDGTLASRTDFQGRQTDFAYDVNARLVRRDHPDGTSVTWSYTPTGQVASFTDTRGTTTFTYDSRDRVTSKTYPDGRRLDYSYDAAGNRTALTATVGATVLTTGYGYDVLNRLETITDSSGGNYTHSYDAVGNRASLSYPNGVSTSTTFDALNRLSLMATTVGAVTLQSYSYTLDPTGRRTRIDEADGTSRAYAYDSLYRLTQDLVTDGAAALVYQQDYAYDPVGNRLSLTEDTGSGPVVTSYTYDARDRLLTENAVTYAYDAVGNLVSESGTATYAWDTQNRLDTATLGDGTQVTTIYDPDGNRVSTETTPPGGPTETVKYLVDTSGPLSQVIVESDGAGNVLTYYERGDELVSLFRPGTTERRFYHADGLGSIRLLTDGTGAVTDGYSYTAFGVQLDHTGTDIQPYRFAGEPFDSGVGLYYNRARWLDVGVGRFVSMDPFQGGIQDPVSLHRYLYASVDPVGFTDPTGQFTLGGLTINLSIQGILSSIGFDIAFAILDGVTAFRDGVKLGSILQQAAFDVALGAATGGLFGKVTRILKARKIAAGVFRSRRVVASPWWLPPFARGRAVEAGILGRRPTLAHIPNFPTIDDWIPGSGLATSIKSTDMLAATYQTRSGLFGPWRKAARQLDDFAQARRGNINIRPGDVKKKRLLIGFEDGAPTTRQVRWMEDFRQEAMAKWPDIEVLFQPFP